MKTLLTAILSSLIVLASAQTGIGGQEFSIPHGCIIAGSGGKRDIIVRPKHYYDYDVRGVIDGNHAYVFQPTRSKNHWELKAYESGRFLYSGMYPGITLRNGEYWSPGEPNHGYDFYPSHDTSYLFAVIGLCHNESASILYRRHGARKIIPVCPGGRRFDEAALRSFEAAKHIANRNFGCWTREIYFDKWSHAKLYFTMEVRTYWAGSRPGKYDFGFVWQGSYSPHTGKFAIVHCESA